MDEKKQALLAFCQEQEDGENLTIHDIVKSEYDENVYETPVGEFSVLTDKEADDAFRQTIKDFIDYEGVEGFSEDFQKYILNNCIDESSKKYLLEGIEECATEYMEDISFEDGFETNTLTRQQEEIIEFLNENTNEISFDIDNVKEYEKYRETVFEHLYEEGKIEFETDLDDINNLKKYEGKTPEYAYEIAEFLKSYDDNSDRYIELYAEDYSNDYKNNPLEYYQDNFGEEEIKAMIAKGKITFDIDKIAEEVERSDGRGNLMASCDGNENEQYFEGETFYIYQQDNTIIDKVVDMIDEIFEDNSEQFANVLPDDIMELLDNEIITRETLENKDIEEILENIDNNKNIDITD